MSGLHSRLKEITADKKRLNLGDISPFFHLVATSVGELEGIFSHGFESPIKHLLDKGNWNRHFLGVCNRDRPQLMLRRTRREKDYHVLAFALRDGEPVLDFQRLQSNMDFVVWDPTTMSNLLKLSGLLDFVPYALLRGDSADKALVDYAHEVVNGVLNHLGNEIEIVEDKGPTVLELKDYALEQFQST